MRPAPADGCTWGTSLRLCWPGWTCAAWGVRCSCGWRTWTRTGAGRSTPFSWPTTCGGWAWTGTWAGRRTSRTSARAAAPPIMRKPFISWPVRAWFTLAIAAERSCWQPLPPTPPTAPGCIRAGAGPFSPRKKPPWSRAAGDRRGGWPCRRKPLHLLTEISVPSLSSSPGTAGTLSSVGPTGSTPTSWRWRRTTAAWGSPGWSGGGICCPPRPGRSGSWGSWAMSPRPIATPPCCAVPTAVAFPSGTGIWTWGYSARKPHRNSSPACWPTPPALSTARSRCGPTIW